MMFAANELKVINFIAETGSLQLAFSVLKRNRNLVSGTENLRRAHVKP